MTADDTLPYWFNAVVTQAAKQGCTEDWSKFHWAKKLAPARLKIGCMGDGKLIVAPDVVALDGPVVRYYAAFPVADELAPKVTQDGKYLSLVYFTDRRGRFNAKAAAAATKNMEPLPWPGTDLVIIYNQKFRFCAVNSAVLTLKKWPQDTPFFCGVNKSSERYITSIDFSIDDTSSVQVWLPKGLPLNENPSSLHKKLLNFVQSFRQK